VYLFQGERALRKSTGVDVEAIAERLLSAVQRETVVLVGEGCLPAEIQRTGVGLGLSGRLMDQIASAPAPATQPGLSSDWAVADRLIAAMVREIDALAEAGRLGQKSDADVIAVRQLGFPAYLGGPNYMVAKT
jgi:hypothetical protein